MTCTSVASAALTSAGGSTDAMVCAEPRLLFSPRFAWSRRPGLSRSAIPLARRVLDPEPRVARRLAHDVGNAA